MSESQCSILLRAKLVGSRCYDYRYPVKVKSTLILAAVKRSYLKALDIVAAQAESQEEGPIMLGTDPQVGEILTSQYNAGEHGGHDRARARQLHGV